MHFIELFLLSAIVLNVNAKYVLPGSQINASQTEINILRRLGARINEPINFDGLKISSECRRSSRLLLDALENFELWALQMHDSSGKIPSGILRGNIHQYGDFDHCLGAVAPTGEFRGKFCLANFQPAIPESMEFLHLVKNKYVAEELVKTTFADPTFLMFRSSEIHWAFCVPSTCSALEVQLYIDKLLSDVFDQTDLNFELEVNTNQCKVYDENWIANLDVTTTSVIFLLASYALFVIFSTFYDNFSRSNAKNKWITAFSITKNATEVFDATMNNNDIPVLHGVRFINVICMYLIHKSMAINFAPYANRDYLMYLQKAPISYPFRAALIYVETFLLFSGFLLSFRQSTE